MGQIDTIERTGRKGGDRTCFKKMENAFQVLECMRKALELFVLGLLLKITLMELSGGNGERPIQSVKK